MANNYDIYEVCVVCGGGGVEPNQKIVDTNGVISYEDGPCPACDETGKILKFTVDLTDLEDKINDIIEKLDDIKEVLDAM